jgi:hypothetical protein
MQCTISYHLSNKSDLRDQRKGNPGNLDLSENPSKASLNTGGRLDLPSGAGDVFASTLLFIQLSADLKSQRVPEAFKNVAERCTTVDEYEASVIA